MSILITAIILYVIWVLTVTRKDWWDKPVVAVFSIFTGIVLFLVSILAPLSQPREVILQNPEVVTIGGKRYLFRGYHENENLKLTEVSSKAIGFKELKSKTLFGWENGSEIQEIYESN